MKYKIEVWTIDDIIQQYEAKNLKLEYRLLEELNDIDTLEDLENSKLKY